jgi:hypothetical protein
MYDNRKLLNRNVGFINRVTRYPVHTLVTVLIAGLKHSTGGADKSLARPGRKQATAAEDFEYHISYL